MVKPSSLRCRLGWMAVGLAMDGTFGQLSQLTGNSIGDALGAERESAVDADAAQLVLGDSGFQQQQRFHLRIAVLLDDEVELVIVEELLHAFREGKRADPHKIGGNTARIQNVQRLADRRVASAQ